MLKHFFTLGDMMKFNVDYEHIFFDRFELTDDEKYAECSDIIKRVFKEDEWSAELEKDGIVIDICDDESLIRAKKLIRLLKREFFIILSAEEKTVEIAEATDFVSEAEKYIRKNYLYESLCALEVCSKCNVGRAVLDKAFLERYSKTVSEYIKYIRVEKVKENINSCHTIEKLAQLYGFGSVKTMQRSFKAVCGKTPGEYRKGCLDIKEPE